MTMSDGCVMMFSNSYHILNSQRVILHNAEKKQTEDCQEGGVVQVFLMDPWMIGIESPVVCNGFLLYEVYETHFVF